MSETLDTDESRFAMELNGDESVGNNNAIEGEKFRQISLDTYMEDKKGKLLTS